MIEIDARGLSCPIPVIRVKKVMDKNPSDELIVLIDGGAPLENVMLLAKSRKYNVAEELLGNEFRLILKPMKKEACL
jgi:tRNA 2-thiouridine synthesizing protein A